MVFGLVCYKPLALSKCVSCVGYLGTSLDYVLLNNLFEAEYFRLNFFASTASLTMTLQLEDSWLGSLTCCSLGAACVMTNSADASQWLVHGRFLILYRYSWLGNDRATRLSRLWLVIIIWFSLAALDWMLVWPWLYDLFTTVDPDTSIRTAGLFEIVYFFCVIWLINWYEWVCLRLRRCWNVCSLWRMDWVRRFWTFGDYRFWSSLLHYYFLKLLVFGSQLLDLICNKTQRIIHRRVGLLWYCSELVLLWL